MIKSHLGPVHPGEVLVEVGGVGYRVLVPTGSLPVLAPGASAFLFTPGTPETAGTFGAPIALGAARARHTATLLPDGRVLLAGGWSTSENATTRHAEPWGLRASSC